MIDCRMPGHRQHLADGNDIIKRLKDLEGVGLEYIALHPAGPDIAQLDLWKKHLLPAFGRK